ncbi:FecR family protein [Methylocystis iwaonis]|uniref:Iron dicitrate transporter FecR n=1 Tax=Methylocystis iwaonis TaxID=2885079 RepID=A0ABN6VIS3_9HYPH|nr:FecR family protein [Methylocystis iwaonis]BDV35568.1 iron dicitrate transporter FecR [Methylocystis iwaonis]
MMPGTETPPSDSDDAGDEAIDWFVRLRAGLSSDEEKAAFEQWRAKDAENAAAFEEVLRMFGHLAGMSPSRRAQTPRHSGRRHAAAAVAVLAAALALLLSLGDVATRLRADHYAGVGERKVVALEDGSKAELDARSSIAVRYSAAERRVILLSGEAWFDVARDPARPFVVEAGEGSATALGTAFDVALIGSGARVTVNEHRVLVMSGGASVVVEEGQQSAYERDAAAGAPETVDVEAATAWRRGKLIVTKLPLGDVLATVGRYHRGFIYCVEPSACSRRVSGVFDVADAAQIISEIEMSLGLRAIRLTPFATFLY